MEELIIVAGFVAFWFAVWRFYVPSYNRFMEAVERYDPQVWNELDRPGSSLFAGGWGPRLHTYVWKREYSRVGSMELSKVGDDFRRTTFRRVPALILLWLLLGVASLAATSSGLA